MRIGMWLLQDSLQQWKKWIAGLYYVRNCIEALATVPAGDRPTTLVFAPHGLHEPWLDSLLNDCGDWLHVVRIPERLLARQARAELESLIESYQCDLFFPLMTPPGVVVSGRWVGWITDLQHRVLPHFFSAEEVLHRDALYDWLLATCTRVVCSSRSVQEDLVRFCGVGLEQTAILRFTSAVPAAAMEQAPGVTLRRLGIRRPYIYLPYQFWMHKNHRLALEAWRLIREKQDPPLLVCTGAMEDSRDPLHVPMLLDFVEHHGLEDSVRMLGMIDRNDQWQLYRGATAVLQPSLFEGWSTSVEEAKSVGQTILLSDIPVHREQAGPQCHFFRPSDAAGLAELVLRVCGETTPAGGEVDPAGHPPASTGSLSRVSGFGRELVELFRQVLADPQTRVAQKTLPLLLRYQDIAQERLELIEQLSGRRNAEHPVGRWG